jgi:membrane protease YdiL (CAAX protease family)
MFAFSILYNEIRMVTGSVWPAVLMHCLTNAVGHPLFAEFVKVAPGTEYLISSSGLFMIVLIGSVGVSVNWWRRKTNKRLSD